MTKELIIEDLEKYSGLSMLILDFQDGVYPSILRVAPGALPLKGRERVLGADLLQSVPLTLAFPDREMILYV